MASPLVANLSLRVDHAHQMRHLGDHAANLRRIGQLADAADPVEPEPDQGLALGMLATNRATDLLDLDHFTGLAHVLSLRPCVLIRQPARCRPRGGAPAGWTP